MRKLPCLSELSIFDNGKPVLAVALAITLYFRNGHAEAKRYAVAACLDQFRQMAGTRLRWAMPGKQGPISLLNHPNNAPDPSSELRKHGFKTSSPWEFHWHAGAEADDACALGINAFGTDERSAAPPLQLPSFVSARFPPDWFADASEFARLALAWCEKLEPLHGYGGFFAIRSSDPFLSARQETALHELVQRYRGIEIDEPAQHLIWLKHGIKGVNWLTALSNEMMANLPSAHAPEALVPSKYRSSRYGQGLLIQAGDSPQLGGSTDQMASYGELSKHLRPIRITTHSALHGGDPFDRAAMEAWLARFDNSAT